MISTDRINSFNVGVEDKILMPAEDVFDAIVDPIKLAGYFVTEASSPIEKGQNITWNFDDVCDKLDIYVNDVVNNEYISFSWSPTGEETEVEINLKRDNDDATSIKITETKFTYEKDRIKKALEQTQGWTDFICSLKAYLYCGINIRLGRSN